MQYQIEVYQTLTTRKPFDEWFEKLKDVQCKVAVLNRLDRVKLGNFGDSCSVGKGIYELRFHGGPGYRIYYAKSGIKIILLLCAGAKGTQQKDIKQALCYLEDFQMRGGFNAQKRKK